MRRLFSPLLAIAVVAVCALVPLAACDNSVVAPVTVEATAFATALNVNLAASTKTSNGLYYRDVTVGTGVAAIATNEISVYYVGYLANGNVFDSKLSPTAAFKFTLGAGKVIAGWDQGIVGMKVGGRRQLIIPPSLAYGAAGSGSAIPPNSVLVFTVDLASIP